MSDEKEDDKIMDEYREQWSKPMSDPLTTQLEFIKESFVRSGLVPPDFKFPEQLAAAVKVSPKQLAKEIEESLLRSLRVLAESLPRERTLTPDPAYVPIVTVEHMLKACAANLATIYANRVHSETCDCISCEEGV